MDVTRRAVGRILAATAIISSGVAAQAPPPAASPNADADLNAARALMRSDAQRLAQVRLPMSTEPAFRFRA
jgi:hypothetical protein